MHKVQSEHVKIANLESALEGAYGAVDSYIAEAGIKDKNAIRLRLLSEEVLRLAKSIIGYGIMEFWLEGDARVSRIYLKAENHLDRDKQKELLSVSSTGENISERGFFGKLLSNFMIESPKNSTWSLKEYEDDLRKKKETDTFSQEAWDDLERSIVANLADDIEVGIDKNTIQMVVTKDFSEALKTIGSKPAEIVSGITIIESSKLDEERVYNRGDELISELEISPKDATRLKLIYEETVGMLKAMTTDYKAEIWFERYKKECCLKLTAKTDMSAPAKKELIDISSDKKNSSVKGVMGKIGDVIENGILHYSEVMKLNQEYGGTPVNYGTMGIYGAMDGMDPAVMWSLSDYRDALPEVDAEKEAIRQATDELEKSIVGSLAEDVLVGVKGNRVDMTIVYELRG